MKSCCFIGHRRLDRSELAARLVESVVAELITRRDVGVFNFGSKSEFDDICHAVVTRMQTEYPELVRVNYNLKNEYVVKKDEKSALEETMRRVTRKNVTLKAFERSKSSERVGKAGKAAYVERNREMIDDSDFCVFFCIGDYSPESSPRQSRGKSGTRLAYDYALAKRKTVINIAEMLD